MTIDGQQARLTALAVLKDPLDRRCFDLVAADGGAVGRDEIAEALGLPRASAAFRLDRLVEVGLLEVEFRRRSGRTGPGAGRPAKLYRVALQEVGASVPERHYELFAGRKTRDREARLVRLSTGKLALQLQKYVGALRLPRPGHVGRCSSSRGRRN